MNISDLNRVQELTRQLAVARNWLANANRWQGETVKPWVSFDYGSIEFELPPIPKSHMVSSCERAVSKFIGELAQLGVTVDGAGE